MTIIRKPPTSPSRALTQRLAKSLAAVLTEYESLLNSDYGTHRDPRPADSNPAIQRGRASLASWGRQSSRP